MRTTVNLLAIAGLAWLYPLLFVDLEFKAFAIGIPPPWEWDLAGSSLLAATLFDLARFVVVSLVCGSVMLLLAPARRLTYSLFAAGALAVVGGYWRFLAHESVYYFVLMATPIWMLPIVYYALSLLKRPEA